MAAIAGTLGLSSIASPAPQGETPVIESFQRAVQAYVEMERGFADRLAATEMTADSEQIYRHTEALARAVAQAREDARRGEVFLPQLSAIIRRRVRTALLTCGYRPDDVFRALVEQTSNADPPVVNGRFAWATAAPMPTCVLLALPEVPEPLQYRFVRGDLVLVDTNANLIVDVLPDALEAAGT
jgi:hypothetical protein